MSPRHPGCHRAGVVSGGFGGFGWAAWRRCRWHDFPGERTGARDDDELAVAAAADLEEVVVCVFEDAQHVGHLRGAVQFRWAPADRDPLADVGGGDPDHEPVAHAGHLHAGEPRRAGAVSCRLVVTGPAGWPAWGPARWRWWLARRR